MSVSRRIHNAQRRHNHKGKIAFVALVIASLGLWLPLTRVTADGGTPDGSGESAPIVQPVETSPPPTEPTPVPDDVPPPSTAESTDLSPTVIPTEPTVASTAEPIVTADSTGEPGTDPAVTEIPHQPDSLTCANEEAVEISPGEMIETNCSITIGVHGSGDVSRLTAVFESVPGPGWELQIAQVLDGETLPGPRGVTTVWTTSETLASGSTIDLIVRVFVPNDAEPGQQATIVMTVDDALPNATWNVAVSEPMMLAPLMMVADALTCSGPSAARPGAMVAHICTIDPGLVENPDLRNLSIELGPQTPGWGVGLTVGATSFGPWTSFSTTYVLHLLRGVGGNPGTGGVFEVIVHVPGDAQPGSTGTTTIGVRVCHTWDADPCPPAIDIASIETTVAQADDHTDAALLECASATNYTIESGGSASLDCGIESLVETVNEGVHLYNLTLGGLPTGWTATATGGSFNSTTNTLTFTDVFLGEGSRHPFALTIGAPCGATTATISLTSSIGVGPASPAPMAGGGPALQFDLAATGVSGPATVTFSHGDSTLSLGSISSSEPIAATWSAGLTITPPDCLADGVTQSVNLSISAEDSINFNLAGGGDTGRIPLAALTLTGITGVSGGGITVNPPGSPVQLADGYEIATIETAGGDDQIVGLTLSLNVDAGAARPGTHSATLTVTITGEDP